MIFRPALARAIRQGRKTQTRRPIKTTDTDGFGITRCRYREGRDYAVQPGRGKTSTARITILKIEQQRLDDITYKDARAEGFKTTDDFRSYWTDLHGTYNPDQQVWAITFQLAPDPIRLLARPQPSRSGDYTDNHHLAIDDLEAVDAATLNRFTVDARVRFTNNREGLLEREAKTLARCVRNDALAATRAGYDITYELADIRRSLESIRSKRAA